MAVLPALDRLRISAWLQRLSFHPGGITKPQLDAAIQAVDSWVDDNQASFNLALPQPYRSTATLQEKTDLLSAVIQRRAGRLKVEEDN